jgi:hypothetical protein
MDPASSPQIVPFSEFLIALGRLRDHRFESAPEFVQGFIHLLVQAVGFLEMLPMRGKTCESGFGISDRTEKEILDATGFDFGSGDEPSMIRDLSDVSSERPSTESCGVFISVAPFLRQASGSRHDQAAAKGSSYAALENILVTKRPALSARRADILT